MIVVKNEDIIPVDVDNTLILDKDTAVNSGNLRVDIFDPVTKRFLNMLVHEPMVRLLREQKHRGSYIIVWSKGGYEWASNVVRALGLVDCVDLILTKPRAYLDDTPVKKWLKERVYLSPKHKYKK